MSLLGAPTLTPKERLINEAIKKIDFIPFGLHYAAILNEEIPYGEIIRVEINDTNPFTEAIVIAVGNGILTKDGIILPRVKIGDSILFKNFIKRINSEGGVYFVLKEEDIILVNNKENKNG